MTETENIDPALHSWARDQRALARCLGLSIEDWMQSLGLAVDRRTGLTAAIVGAATARGLGLSVIGRIDGPALAAAARALIDPDPPRVADPVLAEAIRRADELELGAGKGASRLKAKRKNSVATPKRATGPDQFSDQTPTADAPGEDGTGEDS